jgi:DNA-binding transcriptional ArsR family regulator
MTPSPYGKAALSRELRRVRNSKPGTRNDTLNRASFSLGTLVASGHLDEDSVVSALTDAALITTPNAKDDDPMADNEIATTIASGVDAGMAQPRDVPDGFAERADCLDQIDLLVRIFNATPMGGWKGRRMKRLFPGIVQIAYETGGPRNLALAISKLAIYSGWPNRGGIAKGLEDLVDAGWLSVRAPGGPGHSTRYDIRLPEATEALQEQDAPTLLNPGQWCRPDAATVGHDAARSRGLGPAGMQIWQYLSTAVGDWYKQAEVARALGIHASTISRHLKADRPLARLGLIERDERGRVRATQAADLTSLDTAAKNLFTLGQRDRDRDRTVRYFQTEGYLTDDLHWINPADGTIGRHAHWLAPENARERLRQAEHPFPGQATA